MTEKRQNEAKFAQVLVIGRSQLRTNQGGIGQAKRTQFWRATRGGGGEWRKISGQWPVNQEGGGSSEWREKSGQWVWWEANNAPRL